MKITQSKYKDVFAVRLETEKYTALVLPYEGGKIVSFQDKAGKEYLWQNPSNRYLHIGLTDDFEKGECSGFDDMFPTIDPDFIDGDEYPDHGEVCRLPFSYEIAGETLVLYCRSNRLGYSYKKTLREGKDGRVVISYEIENARERDFKCLWAGHCLVRVEKGGQVLLPFAEGEPVDFVYDSTGKTAYGDRFPYKNAYLFSDWQEDAPACKKLYFPRKCERGFVGYQYPSGDTFVMEFDEKRLPYLGIWQDHGVVNGSYCVGLEPCTLGYDTVTNAKAYGQKGTIESGEIFRFQIALSISKE